MNNAIKIINTDPYERVSYAENLIWLHDNVAITCKREPSRSTMLTRKNMNLILAYTTHFKSKIIPCTIS